jgi:FKBP12-rapamycin complex-associated protein
MREISFVDSDATKPYIGEIFPLILESVKDQSDSSKREVALNTLIAIIDNTGFVVKPYFFYPELLDIIRKLVQSEQVQNVRKLVFKLIGTLGAVDPYLMSQIQAYHKQKNENEESEML